MLLRTFGNTKLQVSAFGMGCSRLGSFLTQSSDKEGIATVQLALDSGINVFDTSDLYGQGDSERILGTALAKKRSQAILTTKAGRRFSARARFAAQIKRPLKFALRVAPRLRNRVTRARTDSILLDFSYEYLAAALDASLRRLRTDWVDIFMLHAPPVDVIANEELFHKLGRLKQAGKCRILGVSIAQADHASFLAMSPEISAVQLSISQLSKELLNAQLSPLKKRGIGVVGREVFASLPPNAGIDDRSKALHQAAELPGLDVVLIGMSTRVHLRSNMTALT